VLNRVAKTNLKKRVM